MRSNFITSALTIALSLTATIIPATGEPIATPTAIQQQTSEIDRAIAEGNKLFDKGNVNSQKRAIVFFEKSLELSRSANVKDKQAYSLLALGILNDWLGEKQKALGYLNQSLQIRRELHDRKAEGATLTNISLIYSALGEKQKALESINQSLQIWREMGDKKAEAGRLDDIGDIYSKFGEKQKALDYHNQSLILLRSIGNSPEERLSQRVDEALTLAKIADIYSGLGEKKKALDYYNQALPLLRAVGNQYDEAILLNNIGGLYDSLGDTKQSLEYYNQSLSIVRAIGYQKGEALTLTNMGTLYSRLGDQKKALEYHNQSLLLSRAVGDRKVEASVLSNIGVAYSKLGEKQKALENYSQSLPLRKAVGDREGEAFTLDNIGRAYEALGKIQQALDHYHQSLMLSRAVEDRETEARTLSHLGSIYNTLGEEQKALDYYNQSLLLSRAVSDRSGEAATLNNMAVIYIASRDNQKALEYYNKSLLLTRAVGDLSGEATILNSIGVLYSVLGKPQQALDYQHQSLPLRRAVGDRAGEAATLFSIGVAYSLLGDQEKALDYYNQSLPLRLAVGDREGEAATLFSIGTAISGQQQPALTIAFYKQSVNVLESIRADNDKLPRELQESYAKRISKFYQNLADLLIAQGRLPEAQAVLELLKLKEINTYTRNLPKNSPGISFTPTEQKALDEFLNTYGTAATFARQLSDCAETKCPTLTTLQDQRDRTNTIIRDMLDRLRTTLKDQVIDLSKLNTEEFNNAAKAIVNAQPGTVLIYPIITETKIQFLLAFKAGTGNNAAVTFRAIDGENINSETVFKTAQTFRESLQSANSDLPKLKATSQQLYRWLIKPLEPEINQPHIKHLVFATDRVTRNIPIAALHDGQNYLITKPYSLSTITSATGTTPNALPPTSPKVLAVGASQFTGASALPYVETETNAIVQTTQTPKGIFPGDRFLNQQFTFDTLKSNLSNHNILHIATHGFLDAGNIDNSHLLTSNGDKIDKSKIQLLNDYGLNNIHLVILSACNTATGGKNSDGLEIAGISHYFMKNGTKSVIASLWQVNDPATALFMQQFYQQIQSGKTKAQALQHVQQAFITDRLTLKDAEAIDRAGVRLFIPGQLPVNSLAHPYYWSPFILIGNNL